MLSRYFFKEDISMILLSNQANQTIAPGQSIVFDLELYKRGRCECHRTGSAIVALCTANPYEVSFSGNVTNSVAGEVQLSITVDGEVAPGGTMINTPSTVGDINNIAKTIPASGCCRCGMPKVAITNTGANPVILQAGASLYIRPRC